jgi:hypothetical protein
MTKKTDVEVGDLVMWVDSWRKLVYGKVIGFDYRDRPIAREIAEFGDWSQDENGKWRRGEAKLQYKHGHIVASNYFVIAHRPGSEGRTMDKMHPITKARHEFAILEIEEQTK